MTENHVIRVADGTEVPPGDDGEYGGRVRRGRIECVRWDGDVGKVYVMISWAGACQGFGWVPLDLSARFLLGVARAAGILRSWVGPREDLALSYLEDAARGSQLVRDRVDRVFAGAQVTCLWCQGENNERMEGIEGPGGRLTVTGFLRACGFVIESPLIWSQRSLEREIAWSLRRAEEARERLRQLPARHWDPGDGTVTG
jgi:hypothetical protein